VVQRGTLEPHGEGLLSEDLAGWIAKTTGHAPADLNLFERALTHGSQGAENYERLEFLGDRVLGLVMAEWLTELFPGEAEGALSKRLHALVSGAVCADVARSLGVGGQLRLGKQARDDGAGDSDNVLGDAMESLIGALYRDAGLAAVRDFIRQSWGNRVSSESKAPQHPKSALLEWAAANKRRAPTYEVVDRSGPDHAPRFTVKAAIGTFADASASGGSKQEAETAAAASLLEKLG
jgi:ribonuclease-3